MTGKLYGEELLKRINGERELKVLEAIWNDDLSIEKKIEFLLKEESKEPVTRTIKAKYTLFMSFNNINAKA